MVRVAIRVAVAFVALEPLVDVADGVQLSTVAEESHVVVEEYGHQRLTSNGRDGDESLAVAGQEAAERHRAPGAVPAAVPPQTARYSDRITTGYGGGWGHPEIPNEEIDAWIYCPHTVFCTGLEVFAPMVVFAQDALEGIGARTRTRAGTGAAAWRMVQSVRLAVDKGRQPLVLALGVFAAGCTECKEFTHDILEACSHYGAYVVVYQPEQGNEQVLRHLRFASEVSAKEMWDYSLSGVRTAHTMKDNPKLSYLDPHLIVRHVPPGYSKFLEAGVDLFSPERREDLIGFLGLLTTRPLETRLAYEASLGTLLNQTTGVWQLEALREWCNALPLQLNVHRFLGGDVHLEAFRFAPLLANKACVITQPGREEDMALWGGIVHFADVNHTKAKMHELQQDVRGCQEQSYHKFKVDFDPLRILRNSGFPDAWQPPSKLLGG